LKLKDWGELGMVFGRSSHFWVLKELACLPISELILKDVLQPVKIRAVSSAFRINSCYSFTRLEQCSWLNRTWLTRP